MPLHDATPAFVSGLGGPVPMVRMVPPPPRPPSYILSGVTRNSAGAALAGCTVEAFETPTGHFRASTVSDANGNYRIGVTGGQNQQFFLVAYLAGTTDVCGTTVNTLVGVGG